MKRRDGRKRAPAATVLVVLLSAAASTVPLADLESPRQPDPAGLLHATFSICAVFRKDHGLEHEGNPRGLVDSALVEALHEAYYSKKKRP